MKTEAVATNHTTQLQAGELLRETLSRAEETAVAGLNTIGMLQLAISRLVSPDSPDFGLRRFWELASMPYQEYLRSDDWTRHRTYLLYLAHNRCRTCDYQGNGLQVHHRHYRYRGFESLNDVTILCPICHKKLYGDKGTKT
jgi:hypothetical protein